MSEYFNHSYPGPGVYWTLDVSEAVEVVQAVVVRDTLALLAQFLLPYELRLEAYHASGYLEAVLRTEQPYRLDHVLHGEDIEVAASTPLRGDEVASWIARKLRATREPVTYLGIRSGCVEARAPAHEEDQEEVVLLVDGDPQQVPILPGHEGKWLGGPVPSIRVPPPVELRLAGAPDRWDLDLNLLWSTWELADGGFEVRLRELSEVLERAGWTRARTAT